MEGGGFEPPKLSRQIYSLIPLATREPLRKAAHCPDGANPCQPVSSNKIINLQACATAATSPRQRPGIEHFLAAPTPLRQAMPVNWESVFLKIPSSGQRAPEQGVKYRVSGSKSEGNGAGERNRTPDRLITSQLLYLLSYASNSLTSSLASMPAHRAFTTHQSRHPVGPRIAVAIRPTELRQRRECRAPSNRPTARILCEVYPSVQARLLLCESAPA